MSKKQTEQNTLEGKSITATKPNTLENGLHIGDIKDMTYRKDENYDYEYIDIHIETVVNDEGGDRLIILKAGFPLSLSENTKFGKFLKTLDFGFDEGNDYTLQEIHDYIIGKKISFQTITDDTPKGTFSRILRETIKLKTV